MGDKLVRDKIPEIIREQGKSPKVRIAGPDELDVLLRELLKLRKADPGLIEIQRHSKLLARGGFTQGYVLTLEEEDE